MGNRDLANLVRQQGEQIAAIADMVRGLVSVVNIPTNMIQCNVPNGTEGGDEKVSNNHIVSRKQKEVYNMIAISKLKKKLPNGTVRIIKRKRGNDLIEYRFYHESRKTPYSVYGHTADEVIVKYENWTPPAPKKVDEKPKEKDLTLDEYYFNWKTIYLITRDKIRDATIKDFDSNYRRYVKPVMGHKLLKDLTAEDVQIVLNKLSEKIRQRTIVYRQMNQYLGQAGITYRKQGVYNPCEGVKFKQVNVIDEGIPLTIEQQRALELYCMQNPSRETLYYLVDMSTGMRPQELLDVNGITDVDRVANTIHIKGTKTEKADAVIIFPKHVIDMIPCEEKPFDFKRNWLGTLFKNVCKKLDIPTGKKFITLKSLRKTFATRCRENGMQPEVIKHYLRHTKVDTTETYIVTQEMQVRNSLHLIPFDYTHNHTHKTTHENATNILEITQKMA